MYMLKLIPDDTRIPFMRFRHIFVSVSGLAVAAAIVLLIVKGLTFGIDFAGGILVEVRLPQVANLAQMRDELNKLNIGTVNLQEFGKPTDVLIRLPRQEGGEKGQETAVAKMKQALGTGVDYRRTEFVGPKVSKELLTEGMLAVGAAMIAMLIYIWLRFEWQFGLAAVTALMHDVLLTLGVFSLLGLEFDLSTVAAVLTIAGYSINDTVVVFDRIREDLRKYKALPFDDLLNGAINSTLSRTVLTSGMTLVAVLALFFLGGEVIRDFSFAMTWGIVVGTYSSICVAVPLLLYFGLNTKARGGAGEEGDEDAGEEASERP